MEILAFFIWILLAFAIPLILIVISGYRYTQQADISKVIFRFFIAIVVYVPFTLFALIFFGGLLNAVVHKKLPTFGEIVFCFVIVFVYGVIGFLLCAFVNGGVIKPWRIFIGHYNKPQSIFDK